MSAEGGGGGQSAMTQCWDLHGDDRTRVPHLHVESGPSAETAGATRPDIPAVPTVAADAPAVTSPAAAPVGRPATATGPAEGNWRERAEQAETERDRLAAELEHAKSALAGDHEGIRLWMLDCGELVAKHRARAEAAEARLAEIRRTIAAFLTHHGNSAAFALRSARDLAEGIRQVLDREALEDGKEPRP